MSLHPFSRLGLLLTSSCKPENQRDDEFVGDIILLVRRCRDCEHEEQEEEEDEERQEIEKRKKENGLREAKF